MAKKLPATLYVKTEEDRDASWFVADESHEPLVDMNEKIKIGVYKLTEMYECEGIVSTKKVTK